MGNPDHLPRKLAAIFYADVAGYSRLTGKDEDTTHRRLSEYLDLIAGQIARHGGHVMHYAGDAVLAMFDAVTDALLCAAQIQRSLETHNTDIPDEQKVQFRIGVNLGDVIEDRGDIYGDGVNVAARLESLAEPGGICISESVHTAVGEKLPLAYEDLGEQEVKNIAKPVRTYRVQLNADVELPTRSAPPKRRALSLYVAVVVAIVMVVAGGFLAWLQPWQPREEPASIGRMAFPLPDKPSIAVLPFTNLSDDPQQEYFSDGITDDLITNLSLYRELFVVSRNSTFVYKGKAVDVKRVAQELGVQYVLEGSTRRENEQIRINVQLIDALKGDHVWAERFDRKLTDVFAVQDELAALIAGRIAPELKPARVRETQAKPTSDLTAWDLLLQARDAVNIDSKEGYAEAERLCRKALERDENFAAAHATLSVVRAFQFLYGWTDDPSRSIEEAIEYGTRAVSLDDRDPLGFRALGTAYRFVGNETLAISNLKRAVELNPNDANGRREFATALDWFRHQREALPHILEAKRLSPRDPEMRYILFFEAHILYHLHDYEAALAATDEMAGVLKKDMATGWYHQIRAATFAQLGQSDEAREEIEKALALNPKLSLSGTRQFFTRSHLHPENLKEWLDGLRKAGLSE